MAAKGRAMVERRGRRAERKKEARLAVVSGEFMGIEREVSDLSGVYKGVWVEHFCFGLNGCYRYRRRWKVPVR